MKKILLLLPFLLFADVNNAFFKKGNTGWFFGDNEKNETNKTKKMAKINPYNLKQMMKLPDDKFMASIPLNNLDLYSAEDFQKVFKRAKGIAVMHPTQKNVYIVKKMQKFMTDQATKFAKVWYVETLQRPNELEYPGINAATFAKTANYYKKKKEYNDFFKKHTNDIGFVVFYNPKDKMFNTRQKWIYKSIKKEYPGYDVVWVDVSKRPDLVKKFNIKVLPDNFYVYKNKKGEAVWVRIKAGLVSESELKDNVIFTFDNIIAKKDK
jgi:conjugal transfer pilus assembly protein TraF